MPFVVVDGLTLWQPGVGSWTEVSRATPDGAVASAKSFPATEALPRLDGAARPRPDLPSSLYWAVAYHRFLRFSPGHSSHSISSSTLLKLRPKYLTGLKVALLCILYM